MSWLTSSLLHSDPRGTSSDMSMTPAPFIPVSSGPTAHSRAAGHTFSPSDSSASILRSLSPGMSAARSQARAAPAHGPAATDHGLTPSPGEGKRQLGPDSASFRARNSGRFDQAMPSGGCRAPGPPICAHTTAGPQSPGGQEEPCTANPRKRSLTPAAPAPGSPDPALLLCPGDSVQAIVAGAHTG